MTAAPSNLGQVRGEPPVPGRTQDPTWMAYFGFVLFLTIPFASIFWEGHTNISLSEAPTLLASATASKAWT